MTPLLWNACRSNEIRSAGAAALAAAPLPSLRTLMLGGNRVGDKGAASLSRAVLPALSSLTLSDCGIGDAGAAELAAIAGLPSLQALHVDRNPLTAAGEGALRERWPEHVLVIGR